MSVIAVVLRYWREAAIAAAILFGVSYCHARDVANVEKGRLEVELRAVDSVLAVAVRDAMDARARATRDSVGTAAAVRRADSLSKISATRGAALDRAQSSLTEARRGLDSAIARASVSSGGAVPDSVLGAIRAFERQSDSTVAACRADQAARIGEIGACRAVGDSLRKELLDVKAGRAAEERGRIAAERKVEIVSAQRPGAVRIWAERIGIAGVSAAIAWLAHP